MCHAIGRENETVFGLVNIIFIIFIFIITFFLVLLYSNTHMEQDKTGNFSKTNIIFYSRAIFLRGGEGRGCVGGACTYNHGVFPTTTLASLLTQQREFPQSKASEIMNMPGAST